MKINRLKLIELLKNEQARMIDKQSSDRQSAKQKAQSALSEYRARTREDWLTFAETIKQVVGMNEVITPHHIPGQLRGPSHWGDCTLKLWDKPKPNERQDVRETMEYRKIQAIVTMLEAAEDETISTYALEKAGFRLEHIMRSTAEL